MILPVKKFYSLKIDLWVQSYQSRFDGKETKGSPGMLFINTFEIIARPVTRKITQIGLISAEIDTLGRQQYSALTELMRAHDFLIYQKEIRRGKLTQSN